MQVAAKALVAIAAAVVALLSSMSADADTIEFLSGSKLEGKVAKIDKQARTVTFDSGTAGAPMSRTFPYDRIHAVTMDGKRYVLNEKGTTPGKSGSAKGDSNRGGSTKGDSNRGDSSSGDSPSGKPNGGGAGDNSDISEKRTRSRAEVESLIEEVGRKPPEWFESTPLDYPKSLDLAWPEPAPGGWNNQANVGQYVWDIINPNPSRWRSGIRLMHHLLTMHQNDAAKRTRVMNELASMYFRFFQDYPRAAFWWRKAGVKPTDPGGAWLAECYWRLGNKQMATEILKSPVVRAEFVKLWGDMGETKQALTVADQTGPMLTQQGFTASPVYLHAGDACRLAGRYSDAIRYYQKVLDEKGDVKGKVDQAKKRAAANIESLRLFTQADVAHVADGSYRAKSLGYEGDVEVEVTVRSKRIEEVKVVQHKEKQFYSALTDVPRQIVRKQSVKGVDATSRATITAEAIINATAKALASGASK